MTTSAVGLDVASLSLVKLVHLDIFDVDLLLSLGQGVAWWQRLLKQRNIVDVDRLGEGDTEVDVEIAELVVSVAGHTLTTEHLYVAGLDHLAGGDVDRECVVIEVLDEDLTTAESSEEVDLYFDKEVVLPALEARVGLLVDDNDNIAWNGVGCLIGLFLECDLLAILHSLVDADLEDLALLVDLLAVALLAAVLGVDDLTLTLALGAGLLHLLNHGAELAEDDLDTLTIASATCLDSTFLATATLALFAENVLLEGKLGDLADVELLERYLDTVYKILALAGAAGTSASTTEESTASATEELREEILGVHAATHSLLVKTLLAESVIEITLFGIREDFVCCGDVLESFLITTLVWVLFQCLLTVGPASCKSPKCQYEGWRISLAEV